MVETTSPRKSSHASRTERSGSKIRTTALRRMRFLASHTGGDLDLYTRDLVAETTTVSTRRKLESRAGKKEDVSEHGK